MSKPTTATFEGQVVPAAELDFDTEKEPWSIFRLEDGTVLRLKQTLVRVCKLQDRFKEDGDPIYVMEVGGIVHTEIPAILKKQP